MYCLDTSFNLASGRKFDLRNLKRQYSIEVVSLKGRLNMTCARNWVENLSGDIFHDVENFRKLVELTYFMQDIALTSIV